MNSIVYKNRYGSIRLTPVSDYMPVRSISSKILPQGAAFSIETAEQIALITENRNIQISFIPDNMRVCYVLHHNSTSVAAICQVSIEFTSPVSPQAEIKRLQKAYY